MTIDKTNTNTPALIAWPWRHEDGEGLTLQLDLIPATGGRIVLRAPKHGEEEGAAPPAP
jgi:hypothetical protein